LEPLVIGNREVRIKLAKQDKKNQQNATPGEDKKVHAETVTLIAERTKEVVKHVAIAAVGVYAAFKTIDTLSQIAVKKTKSADKQD
jgi:hypothetical protein